MMRPFIITFVFSVFFLISTPSLQAEVTGKVHEEIPSATHGNVPTKALLEKRYDLAAGKKSYESAGCAACHDNAVMGAPKPGVKKAWAARLDHGWDQIVAHSLVDYNSMPAKGGNSSLTDKDIANIAAYMVSLVVN